LQLPDDGFHSGLPLAPWFQVDHSHAVAGAGHFVDQTITGERRYGLYVRHGGGYLLDFVEHTLRSFYGCAGWGGDVYIDHPLVFGWDKAAGQPACETPGRDDEEGECCEGHCFSFGDP